MDDEKRQQALDNFRNALGRLEQSGFTVHYIPGYKYFEIHVWSVDITPNDNVLVLPSISNHTLRLKIPK